MTLNTEELRRKKEFLETVKHELKQELFGLDDVIDKVIDSVRAWYLIPHAITHPIIINLFGLTGTGKTQLVRSLVTKLGFSNKFVEIQMDGFSNGSGITKNSICDILQSSNLEENEVGVILLDEFQRFKTIDENGHEIKVERFQDVWQLLSDGKFSIDFSLFSQLLDFVAQEEYEQDWRDAQEEDKEEEPEKKKKRKFEIYPYRAKILKKLLHLSEPISEIMTWNSSKVSHTIKEFLVKNQTNFIDYSKCLIFICGNLDEAFNIAADVDDSDTDADIFHHVTKQISVSHIKSSLRRRFKPEQIARLGNNIVIYPSLSRQAYMQIIRNACQKYIIKIEQSSSLKLVVDEKIYVDIYDNSVFPSQGTRPVFSSIHKIFGASLTEGILWALENQYPVINLSLNAKESLLTFSYEENSKTINVVLDIQDQKKKNSLDFNTVIAVHEAGHAIIYAALFNRCPKECAINLATFEGGYVFSHPLKVMSKIDFQNEICTYLGGLCSEELVFGPEYRTSGCVSDISHATELVGKYVRRFGFDGTIGLITSSSSKNYVEDDFRESNIVIENKLKDLKSQAEQILQDNKNALWVLANALLNHSKLGHQQFYDLMKPFLPNLSLDLSDLTTKYHSKFLQFR